MPIGERIQELRKSKKLLQKELAAKIGVTPEAVSFWESNVRMPREKQLRKLAKIFGVTEGGLFSPAGQKTYEIKESKIPIVSSIGPTDKFGNPQFYSIEPPYKTVSFKNCKAIVVDSDSLAPIAYKGQKIIFSETESIKNGDIVFVKLNSGEQLFRHYYKDKKNESITLQTINPSLPQEPVIVDEMEFVFCYKVIGVKF